MWSTGRFLRMFLRMYVLMHSLPTEVITCDESHAQKEKCQSRGTRFKNPKLKALHWTTRSTTAHPHGDGQSDRSSARNKDLPARWTVRATYLMHS